MYIALKVIEKNKKKMTPQQYRTLKGQCLAGDIDGALKGLNRILRRNGVI